MRPSLPLALLASCLCLPARAQLPPPVAVGPLLETRAGTLAPGPQAAAVTLWVHPSEPGLSLLVVAEPLSGLVTYGLEGGAVQWVAEGGTTGVDVLEAVPVAGQVQPLVVAANPALDGLVAYVVDEGTRQLRRVDASVLRVAGFSPRTVALYRSASTGRLYAFTGNDVASGASVVQLELASALDGGVSATPVRTIPLDSPAAGLVADEAQGVLFIAERDVGLSRVAAEPQAGTGRTLIASTADGGLEAPVGGLGLYRAQGGEGYLLLAHPGSDSFVLHERRAPHARVGRFQVVRDGGVDEVTAPRSLAVSARPLGSLFARGLFVAHDGSHSPENHKLVSWADVAGAFSPPLRIADDDDGGVDGGTPARPDGGGVGGLPPGGPIPPGRPVEEKAEGCGCGGSSASGLAVLAVLALALGSRRAG